LANTGQRLRYGQAVQFWGEGLGWKLPAGMADQTAATL